MARRLFQHRLLRADIAEALRYTEKPNTPRCRPR